MNFALKIFEKKDSTSLESLLYPPTNLRESTRYYIGEFSPSLLIDTLIIFSRYTIITPNITKILTFR